MGRERRHELQITTIGLVVVVLLTAIVAVAIASTVTRGARQLSPTSIGQSSSAPGGAGGG